MTDYDRLMFLFNDSNVVVFYGQKRKQMEQLQPYIEAELVKSTYSGLTLEESSCLKTASRTGLLRLHCPVHRSVGFTDLEVVTYDCFH